MPSVSAVVLLSGGLDSTLAAKVLVEQGIHVVGVNFAGAYCPVRTGKRSNAQRAADQLGIGLLTLPIDEGFIEMVKSPRYGRGRNMNPCIDCHILMIKKAWEWAQGRTQSAEGRKRTDDTGYRMPNAKYQISGSGTGAVSGEQSAAGVSFVATGEVLGQRPMSQNKQALGIVARRSGAEGYLLRPLSAKLLEPTIPEQQGLVNRERLLDIQGRSRHRQIELAKRYGITDYPAPAGGCLLTDAGYAARLREALAHNEDSVEVVELLSLGRHFRLPSGSKVIVGRDQAENEELLSRSRTGRTVVIDGTNLPGPLALLLESDKSDRLTAARLCARYSDKRSLPKVIVLVDGEPVEVEPASAAEADSLVVR